MIGVETSAGVGVDEVDCVKPGSEVSEFCLLLWPSLPFSSLASTELSKSKLGLDPVICRDGWLNPRKDGGGRELRVDGDLGAVVLDVAC